MRSFNQYSSSSSPILVLPPQLPPHSAFGMDSNQAIFNSNSTFNNNSQQSLLPSAWSTRTPSSSLPSSAAGRKRSRDEAAPNLEEEYFPAVPRLSQVIQHEQEEKWEYGQGMTLIKPNQKGCAIEASSQTGTWAEEKADQEKAKAAALGQAGASAAERPILRPSKSQRLDLSATPVILEDVSNANSSLPGSPERSGGYTEPTIDDFTRHLGIGWSSINSADADIQAAARGWAKYIENHFPINGVSIRLQSRGLASYLVEANEGYFLFGEDLKQGQLVSTELEKTFANLQGAVPIFDGEQLMHAAASPKLEVVQPSNHTTNGFQGLVMNSTNHVVVDEHVIMNGTAEHMTKAEDSPMDHGLEVEMDMS